MLIKSIILSRRREESPSWERADRLAERAGAEIVSGGDLSPFSPQCHLNTVEPSPAAFPATDLDFFFLVNNTLKQLGILHKKSLKYPFNDAPHDVHYTDKYGCSEGAAPYSKS